MKTMRWIALLAAIAAMGMACSGGGKYADAKKAMREQAVEMERFAARIEKADTGKEAAGILNDYIDRMESMMTHSKALMEKYKGEDLQSVPELKEEVARLQSLGMRFGRSFMKIGTTFRDDPEVQAALERMRKMAENAR